MAYVMQQYKESNIIEDFRKYIASMVERKGPEPEEYDELNNWFHKVMVLIRSNEFPRKKLSYLYTTFGEALSEKTLQGLAVVKPHGYPGDYEIIDKIYTNWVSPFSHLKKRDYFFHWQKAPQAVRNRKDILENFLNQLEKSEKESISVLNVGCGPCRDIYDYFHKNLFSKIHVDCIDMDINAIKYSDNLLKELIHKNVNLYCQNIFRFRNEKNMI